MGPISALSPPYLRPISAADLVFERRRSQGTGAKEQLVEGIASLRTKLTEHALPVLQGWYSRLRREHADGDACTVAAHMAYLHSDVQGEEVANMAQPALEKRFSFVMVSTRVFLHVHHDFELEPDLMLQVIVIIIIST